MRLLLPIFLLPWLIVLGLAEQQSNVASSLQVYEAEKGLSGTLNSIGSDTLNNLVTRWGEGFRRYHPNVTIQVEGKGSSTAPPALIEGTAHIGPMSRPLKGEEIDAFEKRHGYKPTEVRVAIDGVAVFVNKENPLKGLTMQQLDSLFSATRKRGGAEVKGWGQLGASAWRGRAISLFGRNSASGTYGFFQEHVMKNGDFKATVQEQPGSSSVVQAVAVDPFAIGYSSVGYRTSGVTPMPLSIGDGKFFSPTYENALSGDYPLARFLVVYIHRKPGRPVEKITEAFLRFILSRQGQLIVERDGYFPLPASVAKKSYDSISSRSDR